MRKIIEATDYSVSALFAAPKDYGSAMEYIHYIEGTKQYKELVKLMQKYHIEGPRDNSLDFRIIIGRSGEFQATFRHSLGSIDITAKGWDLEPSQKIVIINDKIAEGIIEVKSFCDEFMKLGISSLKSVKDF